MLLFCFNSYGNKDEQYKCRLIEIKMETGSVDDYSSFLDDDFSFLNEGYALGCFKFSKMCKGLIVEITSKKSLFDNEVGSALVHFILGQSYEQKEVMKARSYRKKYIRAIHKLKRHCLKTH